MEGGASDWRGAVVVEETRRWLEAGEVGAVDIEGLDLMAIGTPKERNQHKKQMVIWRPTGMRNDIHAEDGSMLVDTQCSKSILSGIDGGQRVVHPEIP